jgi:hypothetical protein
MLALIVRWGVVLGASILWSAGHRLFLRAGLSRRRKLVWTAFLLVVGIGIGVVLPGDQVWRKFLLLIAILPVLGAVDVWLLRSRRGVSFWIRACGFEVCTVFVAAAVARYLLDLAGVVAFVTHAR